MPGFLARLVDETGRDADIRVALNNWTDDEGDATATLSIGPAGEGAGADDTKEVTVKARHLRDFGKQIMNATEPFDRERDA